ncbi:MAG: DUF2867 domain-containing protein [Vulcanimicrobiaceae bacterium]
MTTLSQPIAIHDVLLYLIAALAPPASESKVYEIGGADTITYRDMMLRYAHLRKLNRSVIIVPFFTPRLSSYWVRIVTPIPARLAQPLILGLGNEVIVREGILIDRRECVANASTQALVAVFTQIGGRRGWLYGNWLWRLRGIMDKAVGGVGLRRGRRSETDLRLGDAVDFWRVEAYQPGHMLRLRAEMKLPGDAWLEFDADALENGTTRLTQTAFFEPRGLFGVLYWYAVAPFHAFIFGGMARAIAAQSERGG